jgi:hypothetical protein
MHKRRAVNGLNLSFLDVMACGLGAVILIFMLVKFNTPGAPVEIDRLKSEIEALQKKNRETTEAINQAIAAKDEQLSQLASNQAAIAELKQDKQTQKSIQATKAESIQQLEQAFAKAVKTKPKHPVDPVALQGKGEENYLLGLKVEGKEIGILLDHSASMSDEKLVDIIVRKTGSSAEKRRAPKWRRALRVFRWLLNRVPETANLTVIRYNDKASILGSRLKVSGRDLTALGQLAQAAKQLTPEKGTDLSQALHKIKVVNPKLDALYVITDGLPTLGEGLSGLSVLNGCPSFSGLSKTISASCREKLFAQTVNRFRQKRLKVNVILLPLEGDASATALYWQWASLSGGLLISPDRHWP